MENQLALFGIFGLIGLAAGFLYDGLRLIRQLHIELADGKGLAA